MSAVDLKIGKRAGPKNSNTGDSVRMRGLMKMIQPIVNKTAKGTKRDTKQDDLNISCTNTQSSYYRNLRGRKLL